MSATGLRSLAYTSTCITHMYVHKHTILFSKMEKILGSYLCRKLSGGELTKPS